MTKKLDNKKVPESRRFVLIRKKDINGISGTGIVAEGIQFADGEIVMRWFGDLTSIEIHKNMQMMLKIHGHEGASQVHWID